MTGTPQPRRVLILGAAGRDFHNFQCSYRDDSSSDVVAFTATAIVVVVVVVPAPT